MSEALISLGLDVGTTSTQIVFSRLAVENRAGAFSVPELEITGREILYQSPVYFTPLLTGELVDAPALRRIVDEAYHQAGLRREHVDTGAIIITGETSRKENAAAVLRELSGYAGEFVVATAGPDLESVLAAKGSGAVELSQRTGKTVLHMDIGGGTSNMALIRDGKITATGCLNVGGRLIKLDELGTVTYVSPVLEGLFQVRVGEKLTRDRGAELAGLLARALEMAAGLREPDDLLSCLTTKGTSMEIPGEMLTVSFSGGVADCIAADKPWLAFGDIGPELGRAIRASRLCQGEYVLGRETIRATVIGAGCHSAQLSGSTVFIQNVAFPLKNLPVRRDFDQREHSEPGILAVSGEGWEGYEGLCRLAEKIAAACGPGPVYVCTREDMAKALGQRLALKLGPSREILCIDRVRLGENSYLDVGAPVGPALKVVVKTLVLSQEGGTI